ncbi:hypothetical protein JL721_4117 [Aureococcus anophagefferens]|nr:hypothetical protein JL721_4117 [Aureococcus anophagefferens]
MTVFLDLEQYDKWDDTLVEKRQWRAGARTSSTSASSSPGPPSTTARPSRRAADQGPEGLVELHGRVETETLISHYSCVDPGGAIPGWARDLVVQKWCASQILALVETAKELGLAPAEEFLGWGAPKAVELLSYKAQTSARAGVGGGEELSGVLRRVLMSRMVPAETRERLGLRHARGLLLHGPPGTGKTLIARGLARVLGDRKPVVVEGPEVFSHLLGASEQAVRGLFKPADDEWKRLGRASSLHVVVLDECDAIMRKRGGGETGDGSFGGAARDGVVNQLLAKLDGMSQQSNILVIGTTNRLDLVDPAALRRAPRRAGIWRWRGGASSTCSRTAASPSAAVLHDLHLLDPRLLPCLAALLREGHADDHRRLALATVDGDHPAAAAAVAAFDATHAVPSLHGGDKLDRFIL